MPGKRTLLLFFLSLVILQLGVRKGSTQDYQPDIHVVVNMVQLNVAVTDNKGNYVTHLRPEDFVVTDDGISQKIATFGEGDEPTRLVELSPENGKPENGKPSEIPARELPDMPHNLPASGLASLIGGSNVFILFDTSNYMFRGI